jgi:hypothetical protein
VIDLSLGKGCTGSDADGAVGGSLAGEHFAGLVANLGDFKGGVKAEGDQLHGIRRGKVDLGFGGEVVGGGFNFGVDHIAGNLELGALDVLLGGELLGGKRRSPGQNDGEEAGQWCAPS